MRLVHLADLHLGHRRHYRCAANGLNQREMDVAQACRTAIDAILMARPDIVCIAGDVFDSSLPRNAATVFACRQLKRLRDVGIPVVVIPGNHDRVKSSEHGSIFPLFRDLLGVDVTVDRAERFVYPSLDLAVTAVPYAALIADGIPEPEGAERYKVLVVHGEVAGLYPGRAAAAEEADIPTEAVTAHGWSYVALGDWHTCHQVGPKAWYSGSLEYVSSNVWGELEDEAKHGVQGKGWLLADLDTGAVEFQPIPSARHIHDLGFIHALGLTAAEVNQQIAERVHAVDITGAICRLKVLDVSPSLLRPEKEQPGLDHRMFRQWKAQALDFKLEFERPARVSRTHAAHPMKRVTLDELWAEKLRTMELPADLDRQRFIASGVGLLASVPGAEAHEQKGAA